jgi:hypothetical protein
MKPTRINWVVRKATRPRRERNFPNGNVCALLIPSIEH